MLGMNPLALLAGAIAAWLFGAVYYGLLAKPWVRSLGMTMEEFKQKQAANKGKPRFYLPFILSFVAELIMAVVLSGILVHLGMFTARAGIISALFCWFGFVLTTIAVNNAFTGRSLMLTVIDAGHWLGVLVIIGAVIGALGP
jgi:ABC-type sulfate transport system permease subunit